MNIVLFGKPGSGKGTIAKLLEKEYGLKHISTGDLIREEISSDSQLGRDLKVDISRGEFASDEVAISLAMNFMNKNECKGYIFDGVPRNKNQCFSFDKLIKGYYIYLDCSDDICIERMENRMNEGRIDANNINNILRKMEVYYEQTDGAVEYYDEIGVLSSVNAELPVKDVFKYVKEIISIEEKIANGEEVVSISS